MGDKTGIRNMVHPGWVRSQNDGDKHWITGEMLVRLYGLSWSDTVEYRPHGSHRTDGLQHFFPRYDGDYQRLDR